MAFGSGDLRAAIIACAVFASASAVAAPKVKPAKPIDIGLSADSSARNVTPLKSGGALYAVADGNDIFVRPVDDKGKVKNAISLTTIGRSEFGIMEARVAGLANGNVAAAWIGRPNGQNAVLIRVVRPDGTAASSEKVISEASAGSIVSNVSVAPLPGGKFAVAWIDLKTSGGGSIQVRVFAANAEQQGLPAALTPPEGVGYGGPRVAQFGDGFVLAYSSGGGVKGVFAQKFTAAGKKSGDPMRLDAPNALTHEQPRVKRLESGGLAFVWSENTYSEINGLQVVVDTKLRGVFLDKKGKRGKTFALDDDARERSRETSVSVTETDAGLLVAWGLDLPTDADSTNRDVRGAIVSLSGKAGKVASLVKDQSREGGPHLATLKDGRVAFGYSATPRLDGKGPDGAFAAFLKVSDK